MTPTEKLKTIIVPSPTKDCASACKEYQMTEKLSKCWTCEKRIHDTDIRP